MAGISAASLLSEFLGTFLLVFTIGCNILGDPKGDSAWTGVSIACVLMVSIYALGGVSGANFNPAVSFALFLLGKLQDGWQQLLAYWSVQIMGGICAGCGYCLLYNQEIRFKKTSNPTLATDSTDTKFALYQILMCEFFYTFMLVYAVLNTAASKKLGGKNQFYGLTIAFSIVAGAYGAGAVSGGCFNPAVAIGIDLSSCDKGFGFSLAYAGIELVAAAFAVAVFTVVRPEERPGESEPPGEAGLVPKLVSEFFGTYMLVLTVGLNVLGKSPAGAFSIAASLMVMINCTGDVSGGHYNPAVTTAILCSRRGKIDPLSAVFYIAVQLCAGLAAGFSYSLVYHSVDSISDSKFFDNLKPTGSLGHVAVAEIVFTFLLAYVVLCVATVKIAPAPEYTGLIIGSCVTVGGCAIGGLSGGFLNPAVAIGVAIPGADPVKALYWGAMEIIGGVLAAGVFMVTNPDEYEGLAQDASKAVDSGKLA